MLGWRAIHLLLLLTYLYSCPLNVRAFTNAEHAEDNYDVRVSLYRTSDEVERATPQMPVRFTTITIPPRVDSIRELLLSSHVYPDSDAMGLMYALNPDVRDPLQPRAKMRIIQIQLTPATTKAFSDGFLLKIYFDDGIIRELISARGNFRRLTDAVSKLAPERFVDPSLRQTTLECVSSVSADFDQIANHLEDRDQPTNHEMLTHVRGDVGLLLLTLSRITTENGLVTAADKYAICGVASDLKIKQQGFENASRGTASFLRWPEAHVLVNTFDPVTQKPVSMLRIHYAAEALQNDPTQVKQFPALSSPTESQLPEADYVFWVTKDGEAAPLSDRVTVAVRKTQGAGPLIVGIIVKP